MSIDRVRDKDAILRAHHVWDAVRDWVGVAAIWTDHSALLHVYLHEQNIEIY